MGGSNVSLPYKAWWMVSRDAPSPRAVLLPFLARHTHQPAKTLRLLKQIREHLAQSEAMRQDDAELLEPFDEAIAILATRPEDDSVDTGDAPVQDNEGGVRE